MAWADPNDNEVDWGTAGAPTGSAGLAAIYEFVYDGTTCRGYVIGSGFLASPWTPLDLAPTAWYRSDMGSPSVSNWGDSSGNGWTLTQSTSADQPAYSATGGPNNVPYFTTTAASAKCMLNTLFTNPTDPFTVIYIGRAPASTSSSLQYLLAFNDVSNDTHHITYIDASSQNPAQYAGMLAPTSTIPLTANSDFLLESYFNGASSTMALNGGTPVSNSPGTTAIGAVGISVMGADGQSVAFGGRTYEAIVVAGALTTLQREQLHAYAQVRYGIP